ncbi:MAG: TonB-dependent receptor [Putridiphycobacter sp.]|nr:TonB-dependent receptor [Putridiphycobacter sp.]
MVNRIIILTTLAFFSFNGNSQISDTLNIVDVFFKNDSIVKMTSQFSSVPHYQLNDYMLRQLGVVDIGEALKYAPGASIKDYGGIGGMKTINFRSLGSAHTGLEIDGITAADQQTGTLNLANQTVFGIASLEMSVGQIQHDQSFASAFLKSNMISVFNTIASPAQEKTLIRTHSEWLSINALQNSILVKQKVNKRWTIGGQGSFRFGSGTYNYRLQNGQQSIEGQRAPTDLSQLQLNGSVQYRTDKLQIVVLGNFGQSNQNLPGAVVYYNPKNKETLAQEHSKGLIKATYQFKNQSLSGHFYNKLSETNYFQDYVLNTQGYIENKYLQNQIGTGLMYRYFLGSNNQYIFVGSDFVTAKLESNQYETVPVRDNINSVVGITKWCGKIKIQGNVSHQQIRDLSVDTKQIFSHYSPFVSVSYAPFKKRQFRVRFFYKNAFRMPSFNDLYYRIIGNVNLIPETANLFNVGAIYHHHFKAFSVESTIDFYQNTVENKIIAIPTKNLFNWSMQNIGKTLGRGVDMSLTLTKSIKKYNITLITNQSFNNSIDITDVNGFTFGHQLPYTPVYFSSYHLNLQHQHNTIGVNILHSGGRYILTENIVQNYLQGFLDIGINMVHTFPIRKNQFITAKVQLNNILNNNYQVVRSFPMPGRHIGFTVQYQLKSR